MIARFSYPFLSGPFLLSVFLARFSGPLIFLKIRFLSWTTLMSLQYFFSPSPLCVFPHKFSASFTSSLSVSWRYFCLYFIRGLSFSALMHSSIPTSSVYYGLSLLPLALSKCGLSCSHHLESLFFIPFPFPLRRHISLFQSSIFRLSKVVIFSFPLSPIFFSPSELKQ